MWRTLLHGSVRCVSARRCAFAHQQQLAPEPGDFLGKLEHDLVLLGYMSLEISDLLLKNLKTVVHG